MKYKVGQYLQVTTKLPLLAKFRVCHIGQIWQIEFISPLEKDEELPITLKHISSREETWLVDEEMLKTDFVRITPKLAKILYTK